MTEEQLHPAATADIEDADEKMCNRNVLQRLEANLGQQEPAQKGDALEEFVESTQHRRWRGARMTDWLIRFEI
eukprot:9417954-Pyramimonas_sp.AAC.1